MNNNYSFKQRVCETAINCSKIYMSEFVENSYLICSNAFTNNPYYVINAHADNFQHLLGIHSLVPAKDFFDKCYDGTLTVDNFDFTGTPIFATNATGGGNPMLRTTPQAFGDKLHTYTIVDAINDGKVLGLRVVDFTTISKEADYVDIATLTSAPSGQITVKSMIFDGLGTIEPLTKNGRLDFLN